MAGVRCLRCTFDRQGRCARCGAARPPDARSKYADAAGAQANPNADLALQHARAERTRHLNAAAAQQRGQSVKPWRDGTPPTPERITIALNLGGPDCAGLYGPEVDEACGVEEPTVDLWETGGLVPTTDQVRRLSMLTGFPMAFFYLPPPAPVTDLFVCAVEPGGSAP